MHFRLSLLMFLNFSVLGAWMPVLAMFLRQRGCSAQESAWIFASNALGAIVAPILWGQIADRYLAAERCITICCLVSGGSLWLAATTPDTILIFWSCLIFWMFMIPALSVSSALAFRHLQNPDREFGKVRLWGTIGWIAIGWSLSAWFRWGWHDERDTPDYADALRLGAMCDWLTGLYAWTLPHTPPTSPTVESDNAHWLAAALDAPLAALRLFRHRSFAVLCGCLFVVYITFTLSIQLTSPTIARHLGAAEDWLPLLQTLAQSTEVGTLILLPVLLVRLGQKGTMVLGLLAWTAALSVFSIGSPSSLVISSLALHGVFISGFLVAGQLFINRLARDDMRASAQGLIQLINGLGLLIGHFVVGWLRSQVGEDYALAFLPGAVVAAGLVVVFSVGFHATRH